MYGLRVFVTVFVALNLSQNVVSGGRIGTGRKGELEQLPPWNKAPPSPITHRNKGDRGDIDPRGSVRYNIGPNGRILRGIITRHREVPVDDNGTGLEQAKEECCFQDSYVNDKDKVPEEEEEDEDDEGEEE